MKYRELGQGLKVSALGLGCMPMATLNGSDDGIYGAIDLEEARATLHRAVDLGVTLFDTAEAYGPWQNESFLGDVLKPYREKVVIATKYGFLIDETGAVLGLDGSPENARKVCEASLKRLGLDTIDIFYLHRIDPNIPVEDSIGAMSRLVDEGKVRHIGICEAIGSTLRKAHAVHPITAVQSEYSLWERELEHEVMPVALELGIGIIPYSPLGRGFLTGGIKSRADIQDSDYRVHDPRYDAENFAENMRLVDVLKKIGERQNVSAAQIALAWLLLQSEHIVPIPGAKRRMTLEDSMAAVDVVLSEEDIKELKLAAPHGVACGARYSEEAQPLIQPR